MKRFTRRNARQWLDPLRKSLREMRRTGEIDSVRGYPIIEVTGAACRIDFAVQGFTALLERLRLPCSTSRVKRLAARLAAGVPITVAEVDHALSDLRGAEDALVGIPAARIQSAVLTEQLAIELSDA